MRLLVEEIISPSTRLLQRSVTQHPSARFPHLRHILVRGTQTGLTWAMRGLPVYTPPPYKLTGGGQKSVLIMRRARGADQMDRFCTWNTYQYMARRRLQLFNQRMLFVFQDSSSRGYLRIFLKKPLYALFFCALQHRCFFRGWSLRRVATAEDSRATRASVFHGRGRITSAIFDACL